MLTRISATLRKYANGRLSLFQCTDLPTTGSNNQDRLRRYQIYLPATLDWYRGSGREMVKTQKGMIEPCRL